MTRKLILLIVAGLTAGNPSADAGGPARPEARMLELINTERARHRLRPLGWNDDLGNLARGHARDMQRAGCLSHLSPQDGADYPERLVRADLVALEAAENIALGRDVRDAHDGLMRSPGHRANILSPDLREVGIGVVRDRPGQAVYVCQDFATLIPLLSDGEAMKRLREALRKTWQAAGRAAPSESVELSARLALAVEQMIKNDQVSTRQMSVPGPSWVYAYTTADPGDLPREVHAHAGRSRGYGGAVTFRRTASLPLGLYWVALALVAQPEP